MNRVYKYTLDVQQRQFVNVPRGARWLRAGAQNEHPVLWALVDGDEKASEQRIIRGVTTGERFNAEGLTYIDSVTLGDWFVFHLFQQPLTGAPDPREDRPELLDDYDAAQAEEWDPNAVIGSRIEREGLLAAVN